MFRSDSKHATRISLRVKRAKLLRTLSNDRHHPGEEIVELHFTELQWAQLLSSIGEGVGIPCTLQQVGRETMPDCPGRDIYGLLKDETKAASDRALGSVKAISKRLEELSAEKRVTKAMLAELSAMARNAIMEARENLPFVASMVEEAAEQTKVDAQAQVTGFIQHKIDQLGLEGISSGQVAALMLGEGEDSK